MDHARPLAVGHHRHLVVVVSLHRRIAVNDLFPLTPADARCQLGKPAAAPPRHHPDAALVRHRHLADPEPTATACRHLRLAADEWIAGRRLADARAADRHRYRHRHPETQSLPPPLEVVPEARPLAGHLARPPKVQR